MRRNAFGQPQPATAEEIIAAMDELELEAEFAQAEIFDGRDQDAPFNGWCADISDADSGENRFCTLGFETRSALDQTLEAAGIQLIMEA